MESNVNKIIIIITGCLIVLLILIPTIIKINESHNESLMLVSEKKITEAAELCYKESVCTEESVTLKFLYQNNYLEKEANPVTKVYYDDASYVKHDNGIYTFVF